MLLVPALALGPRGTKLLETRRCALLHDIGKMGIPDAILLKPGPPTEVEWCATRYPRGMAGEQIPLAARVFAVADVADALHSDRPYRAAWSPERLQAHIASLSGSHFDPTVVAAVLGLGTPAALRLRPGE